MIFHLFLIISFPSCLHCLDLSQRVEELERQLGGLENKVQVLENQLGGLKSLVITTLEQELVYNYGMIRRCTKPEVEHGVVTCTEDDIVPGTTCEAACDPGYTPSPTVTCQEKLGTWSHQIRCELDKSLVVVSGGSDSQTVEILDFHNSTGCDLKIPDIPLSEHGEVRLMHNMFYFPGNPFHLLVCNGLSQSSKASCDSWTFGESEWKHHSYPNIDEDNEKNLSRKKKKSFLYDEKQYQLSLKGRYAASSYSWKSTNYIFGGMLNEGINHHPTNASRKFRGFGVPKVTRVLPYSQRIRNVKEEDRKYENRTTPVFWRNAYRYMKTPRTLFCIARYKLDNHVAVGGHSGKNEKSVEDLTYFRTIGGNKVNNQIPDMETARNGHACVGVAGDDVYKILVSGGADKTHRSGAKALESAEMFSSDTKQWEQVGDMVYTRFGHALVNVGGRIIAFGGKEWNPDVPLKNAEEFDVSTKSWRSLGDVMQVARANFGYALIPHSAIPGCTPN